MTDNDTTKPTARPRARAPKTTSMVPPPASPSIAAKTPSKSDTVIKLLLRAKGATPVELIAATDWQAHSLRAFLSGLRKKGRVIVREARKSGEFAYRIVVALAPAAAYPSEGQRGSGAGDAPSNDTAQV